MLLTVLTLLVPTADACHLDKQTQYAAVRAAFKRGVKKAIQSQASVQKSFAPIGGSVSMRSLEIHIEAGLVCCQTRQHTISLQQRSTGFRVLRRRLAVFALPSYLVSRKVRCLVVVVHALLAVLKMQQQMSEHPDLAILRAPDADDVVKVN